MNKFELDERVIVMFADAIMSCDIVKWIRWQNGAIRYLVHMVRSDPRQHSQYEWVYESMIHKEEWL